MDGVLGIDAAWSNRNASGVALLQRVGPRWALRVAAPSQAEFLGRPQLAVGDPATTSELSTRAQALLGGSALACIAVDMPLATVPVTARRAADDAISRTFGGQKCSTHSPTPTRPGPRSDACTAGWTALGYPLATRDTPAGTTPRLIEVYPHPALVRLCGAHERLPYKVSKLRKYWPALDTAGRRAALLDVWRQILAALAREVDGCDALQKAMPAATAPVAALKRFEDAVDASVCAWVGATYLEGRAEPYGDGTAAVWIPKL